MQASLKSLVSRVLRHDVRTAEASLTIGAPQPLREDLYQFVGGGVEAPRRGWDIEAPRRGWDVEAPRRGWDIEAPRRGW